MLLAEHRDEFFEVGDLLLEAGNEGIFVGDALLEDCDLLGAVA